jgi:adenosine/AMP kinase
MQLITVKVEKPDNTNFSLGQTHVIKSVEDIHEVLVAAVPGIKFGLAFCEASGKCLVRRDRDVGCWKMRVGKNPAEVVSDGVEAPRCSAVTKEPWEYRTVDRCQR